MICGKYEYYQTLKYIPLIMGRSFASSLIRKEVRDDGTIKVDAMQFCTSRGEESDLEEGARAYHVMWNYDNFSDFIVLPY